MHCDRLNIHVAFLKTETEAMDPSMVSAVLRNPLVSRIWTLSKIFRIYVCLFDVVTDAYEDLACYHQKRGRLHYLFEAAEIFEFHELFVLPYVDSLVKPSASLAHVCICNLYSVELYHV